MTASEAASAERPKALLLLKGLGTGGAEALVLAAARRGSDHRLDPEVAYLLPHKDALVPRLVAQGTPVRCYGQRRAWDPRWLLALRRDLIRDDVAVVHSHSPVPAVGARLMSRTVSGDRRPRVVTTLHNTWSSLHPLTRFAYRLTGRLDDAHLSVSRGVHNSLPPTFAERDRVVVHGIDVDQVRSTADRSGARSELGLRDHDMLVGTIANLRRTKGYPDLLEAARTVVDRSDGVRFLAVGAGPMSDELELLRDRAGLTGRFTFTGRRLDATRLLSAFDLFCLPSHHEGLPVVLMEALALGVPVVATRVGGVDELIADGVEGRLVPPRRPDLLADALLESIHDPALRSAFAEAAARRGSALDTEPALREVQQIYSDLLASGSAPSPQVTT